MQRIYQSLIQWHFSRYGQMLFLEGPRQVGKTTASQTATHLTDAFTYLNWDIEEHRSLILKGNSAVAENAKLFLAWERLPIIVFDEIHKYKNWKNFLKGFFDAYKDRVRIIVTGSSKLNFFRQGGDSLMGRYFPYRMHPFSIAEYLDQGCSNRELKQPKEVEDAFFKNLLKYGGFPEPFIKSDDQFSRVWNRTRWQQLFREDIRDLTLIQEIGQLEILAEIVKFQAGRLLVLNNLSQKVGVAVNTVKKWLEVLESFYYCFLIRPYAHNVVRSLIKEPKVYLWNWADVQEEAEKYENFVACHLLKAVQFWTDIGLGEYSLHYIRDKEKREVDFLVIKNKQPWILLEVKTSHHSSLNDNLYRFRAQLKVPHVLQVVFDLNNSPIDCFTLKEPTIVPVQTFLSQLI